MTSKRRYAAVAGIAVLGLGFAGCSDSSSSGSSDSEATSYCDALDNLSTVVAQKDTFTDATPADEVRQWSRDVASAVDDAVDAGRDLTEANTDSLANSFDDVRSTVNDQLSDADTLGDVRAALSSGADELEQSVNGASQTYDCAATPAAS